MITAKVQLHELEKVGLVYVYSEPVGERKMKNVAYKDLGFGRLISIQESNVYWTVHHCSS